MEEVGTQVAAPIVIHQALAGRFCNSNPIAKKRGLPPFASSPFANQKTNDTWNANSWNWDCSRFVAKPSLQLDGVPVSKELLNGRDDENLRLKLGGGGGGGTENLGEELQPVTRPNKRVRSGSPANYPMCQVDNCMEDLSKSKDYHRRHKVCEVHSKATSALVGKQMQRFCQQCSRFHPLSEFDEGKRSCRRRLAGHNRRRRKTQPEDTAPRSLAPGSHAINVNCDMDVVNLLGVLARAQGNTEDRNGKFVPDKDQLIQILSKINSLPLPANLAAKLPHSANTNGSTPNHVYTENQNLMNLNASSPSPMNIHAFLSSDTSNNQSQPSTEGSDSEKNKSLCVDQVANLELQKGHVVEFPLSGGEKSSISYHSPFLPLQLFESSPECDSVRKLPSSRNYLSPDSSKEDNSPMSSPPFVHDLFPMQTSREMTKNECLSIGERNMGYVKGTRSNGGSTCLQLFGSPILANENGSIQSSPYQAGYASSSGSDHSPPSLNSDARDRTGRIIFKLFDKDPSHLPGSLRTQICNWLSNIPSEMESYIRPGCIVLSLYLSMPSFAWDQLEENLPKYVKSLIQNIDIDFWGNGRFLVHTNRQMASHKEGKIRICKSWGAWIAPKLLSVFPVAIVRGQENSLILKGENLMAPGTEIHCTNAAEYNITGVLSSSCQGTAFDEISLGRFKINGDDCGILGRCFIEVENSFRGSYFPVIIADRIICQELRLLEPEIIDQATRSREEVLHFLDELGWLFQRKHNSLLFDYKLSRFKFLLIFSMEHDFVALVKTLLGILLEMNLSKQGLETESLMMLSEIHLLNRAVKRKCLEMVKLLIHYSVVTDSTKYIFMPNTAGPGGITPLHVAASTSSADEIVDALTSDPQEVGLQCWNSVLDANGLSPYAYALMRNNHSYNAIVDRKLANRKTGQISLSVENKVEHFHLDLSKGDKNISQLDQGKKSCSKCAAAAASYGYRSKFPSSQGGLLQRPYIHSMLVVAAVCVCVCVFLRGHPYVGCVSPFAWENLEFGPM